MFIQSPPRRNQALQNDQVNAGAAKARYLNVVESSAANAQNLSPTPQPVSTSIKQIQKEALNQIPKPAPFILQQRNGYAPSPSQQQQQYVENNVQLQQSNLEAPPHSILKVNGERHDNTMPSAFNDQRENIPQHSTRHPGSRPHRIAFEDYNNSVVHGDITNSERRIPGRLPLLPPQTNIRDLEKDALRKLRERAKDLPPPVDEAKFFKPNLRKKQMELHFKTVPQDQRSVPPPPPPPPPPPQPIPQEQELPVMMEDQFHEQSTPGGHWIYQSDVSREDPRVTRLRSQQLYGNFYARGLDVPNDIPVAPPLPVPQSPPQVPQEQENISPIEIKRQKEKPAVQYEVKPWSLTIRKEMQHFQLFYPYEQLDDINEIDLLFSQIITDCRKPNRHRIRQYEKDEINKILRDNAVPPEDLDHPERMRVEIKISVIEAARRWPLYFSRFYNVVEERDSELVNRLLGISESGIRLIARNIGNSEEPVYISDHFLYEDVAELAIEEGKREHLQIVSRKGLVIWIKSEQAEQIKSIIEQFITGSAKNKVFVRATADYVTNEPNLLSFKKDDVIQIITRLDQHQDPEGEWLFGKIDNRYGNLPANYVEPFEPQRVSEFFFVWQRIIIFLK
ncbi:unnamed protein product [Enterobius vermicularis]|uniref:SH3 domain-containing protein n=1 Tax=Enterobius vermicularis TaxID=51028 RepID=A0A0N4V284_ENTVE|nr:unnamed protein product [Enterobius vermicularis]